MKISAYLCYSILSQFTVIRDDGGKEWTKVELRDAPSQEHPLLRDTPTPQRYRTLNMGLSANQFWFKPLLCTWHSGYFNLVLPFKSHSHTAYRISLTPILQINNSSFRENKWLAQVIQTKVFALETCVHYLPVTQEDNQYLWSISHGNAQLQCNDVPVSNALIHRIINLQTDYRKCLL